jgi:hypothetical protein
MDNSSENGIQINKTDVLPESATPHRRADDLEDLVLLLLIIISAGIMFIFINPEHRHTSPIGKLIDWLNPFNPSNFKLHSPQ